MTIVIETAEDRRQWQYLNAPVGELQSGRVRYAAAMYFYTRGLLDADTLEAFRIAAKRDGERPAIEIGCDDTKA
ncbi:MAG: hypothetical protein HY245_03270 [Rhizobiales bacterium]|nr:hypothetical protein [Hyphomicrobiales bacterium]MBI3672447.1 hypothetical protein [Hyphomicrobiales bacterium]